MIYVEIVVGIVDNLYLYVLSVCSVFNDLMVVGSARSRLSSTMSVLSFISVLILFGSVFMMFVVSIRCVMLM